MRSFVDLVSLFLFDNFLKTDRSIQGNAIMSSKLFTNNVSASFHINETFSVHDSSVGSFLYEFNP